MRAAAASQAPYEQYSLCHVGPAAKSFLDPITGLDKLGDVCGFR